MVSTRQKQSHYWKQLLINSINSDVNGKNAWRTWNNAVAGPICTESKYDFFIIDVQQLPGEMEYFVLLFVIEKIW